MAAVMVHDPGALLACLRRLRDANDALVVANDGGIRICIRNDPDLADAETLAFDVCIVVEDDAVIARATANELDMYDDESGCVIVEDFCFKETNAAKLAHAAKLLNAMFLWRVCLCGDRLVKDAHPLMCYACEMTTSAADRVTDATCPICYDAGFPRWMTTTPCCGQKMHRMCRDACAKNDSRCPLCRAAST